MNHLKFIPKSFGAIPTRVFSEIQKRVMLVFPNAWHALFKGRHFTEEGKELYKYAPRAGERRGGLPQKGSYTAKKLRLYGHTLANVYTGRGMREASNNRATSGRHHGGELYARAGLPNIFNLRNPRGRTNPAAEVTTVLKAEQAALEPLAQQSLHDQIVARSDRMGYVS